MTPQQSTPTAVPSEVRAFVTARSPWPVADVVVDREEIAVTITLDPPQSEPEAGEPERAAAAAGAVAGWRERTRDERITIARELEHRYGRAVAWAVRVGDDVTTFTHLAAPVMTRLRQPERVVLDTLVEAGVARSRAHALTWCVQLVGEHTDDWLGELRAAMQSVQDVRERGPVG
jgi:hypothetical protein